MKSRLIQFSPSQNPVDLARGAGAGAGAMLLLVASLTVEEVRKLLRT
jgi:hypothetical protein